MLNRCRSLPRRFADQMIRRCDHCRSSGEREKVGCRNSPRGEQEMITMSGFPIGARQQEYSKLPTGSRFSNPETVLASPSVWPMMKRAYAILRSCCRLP